ncbi:MAG TPA: hypothetical protein PLL66_06440 [Bacteroidales bacterium]|nr:hypothetical protein [Bacteroidales bacterium]
MQSDKLLVFIIIIATCFILSCEGENNENQNEITSEVTEQSDCKSFTKSDDTETSCIEYVYYLSDKKLLVRHINAGFNCCPGDIYCESAISNDTIIISEFEETQDCDCNCLYDINIEISNLNATNYIIKVVEPYLGSQEEIIFSIDLDSDTTGSYCVYRTQYPWGL